MVNYISVKNSLNRALTKDEVQNLSKKLLGSNSVNKTQYVEYFRDSEGYVLDEKGNRTTDAKAKILNKNAESVDFSTSAQEIKVGITDSKKADVEKIVNDYLASLKK